jgi:hypothetical protein
MPTPAIIPVRVRSELQSWELTRLEEHASPLPCTIELSLNGRKVTAAAEDHFTALLQLREMLEKEDAFLIVYGASRNVWATADLRSQGLLAYRMGMDEQGPRMDRVNIFESGPDVQPCTVAEQRRLMDRWFKSIGEWSFSRLGLEGRDMGACCDLIDEWSNKYGAA